MTDLEQRTQVVFLALRKLADDVYATRSIKKRRKFAEELLDVVQKLADLQESKIRRHPEGAKCSNDIH